MADNTQDVKSGFARGNSPQCTKCVVHINLHKTNYCLGVTPYFSYNILDTQSQLAISFDNSSSNVWRLR
jgi:hypothetical protein